MEGNGNSPSAPAEDQTPSGGGMPGQNLTIPNDLTDEQLAQLGITPPMTATPGSAQAGGSAGLAGLGGGLTHTRVYQSRLTNNATGINGNSWLVNELSYLTFPGKGIGEGEGGQINVMMGKNELYFGPATGGGYTGLFGSKATLEVSGDEVTLGWPNGAKEIYYGNSSSHPTALVGQLKKKVDPAGNETVFHYDSTNGHRLEKQVKSNFDGTVKQGLYYEYGTGAQSGVLASVELRKEIGGVATPISRSKYDYHTGDDDKGSAKDLKTAEVEQFDEGSGTWMSTKKSYYGYYKGSSSDGFTHGLKVAVRPEAYQQMAQAGKRPESGSVSDGEILPYASSYLKYDSSKRVKEQQTDGGAKTRHYDRISSLGSDNWTSKSVQTRDEDGTTIIRYLNSFNQTVLRIFRDGVNEWCDYYEYDAGNRMTLHAYPSAIESVNDPAPGENLIVNLRIDAGKIKTFEYYETPGSASEPIGYLRLERVREGNSGVPVTLRHYTYVARTVGTRTIYKVANRTVYRNSAGGGTDPITTSYDYEWYPDTFQVLQRTTLLPEVPAGQNGDGIQYSTVARYNSYGQPVWTRDALGFITYQGYDPSSGALIERIADVDTSKMADVPAGWSTPAGGGLHLVTNWENDALKRKTLELGPPHPAIIDGESKEVRLARYWVYRDDLKQVWTGTGYWSEGGYRTLGAVDIVRSDAQGRLLDGVKAKADGVEGRLSALDRFEQKDWIRWAHFEYDEKSRLRRSLVYKTIPESHRTVEEHPVAGFEGEHYDATRFDYDSLQRLNRTVSPGGTISRTVYDSRGLATAIWVGTNDTGATETDPGNGGADGNNMKAVTLNQYDGGADGGDSLLTESVYPVDDTSGNDRAVAYAYDFRDRLTTVTTNDGTRDYLAVSTYDNLDQIVQSDRYHTSVATGNLLARAKTYFDNRGRTYKDEVFAVNPTTGAVGHALVSQRWFDARSQVLKSTSPGTQAFQKIVYDGLGRRTVAYVAYNTGTSSDDNDVANDIVLSQQAVTYDASSAVIQSTALERYDDATGTGALNIGPAAAQPRGRANFTAAWHDPIGRSVATAAYGTHSGMAFTRPATPPERSDTVLVSTTDYADTGEASRALDPMGIETRWHNDAQGRRVRLIENVVASADESDAGANRTTEYRYAPDGGLSELILKNVVTGDQVTRWIYGTSLDDSGVARTDLVRAKLYPESDDDTDPLDDGIDGEFERIEYAYNRQAQVTKLTDPNGTVHQYDLDRLGRLTEDRVTTFAGHIDATVKRISLGYDLRGLTGTVTSFDNATVGSGTVLNQVAFAYDDFGNLVADRQAHSGAVVTGTPEVGYAYADGSANTIRRTAITYPDGRVLDYGYGTAGGVNDRLSRVESLTIQGEAQAAVTYTYGGTARYLKIQYPEPGVQLSYLKTASQPVGDGGDHYTGYDRFGRVVDMRWVTTSGGAERDRFQWGFDRASNRTWRRNVVAATGHDDRYHYDGLYQVTARQQGSLTLDQAAVGGVPAESEAFAYDPTGNWLGYRKDEAGATVLDQERKNNRDNQIVQFDGSSNGVAYDRAGNARLMPPDADGDWTKSYTLTWDAWNRLVKVGLGATEVATYAYDGLYRRITKTVGTSGTPLHCYYSDRWKALEERSGASADAARQYVWGARPGHRDELVLRDRDTDGNGTLDERLYALMDYYNGTSIVNTAGVVQERYEYSAFGVRSVMAPDFSPRAASDFAWDFGFQGQFLDTEIGYLNYGYRYYNPMLGRWVNRDPIGEEGGVNVYKSAQNNQVGTVDFLGLYDQFENSMGPIRFPPGNVTNCGTVAVYPNAVMRGQTGAFTTSPPNMKLAGCREVRDASACIINPPNCERHVIVYLPEGENWTDPEVPNYHAIGEAACGSGNYYHQTGGYGAIRGPLTDPGTAARAYFEALGVEPALKQTDYCCPNNL